MNPNGGFFTNSFSIPQKLFSQQIPTLLFYKKIEHPEIPVNLSKKPIKRQNTLSNTTPSSNKSPKIPLQISNQNYKNNNPNITSIPDNNTSNITNNYNQVIKGNEPKPLETTSIPTITQTSLSTSNIDDNANSNVETTLIKNQNDLKINDDTNITANIAISSKEYSNTSAEPKFIVSSNNPNSTLQENIPSLEQQPSTKIALSTDNTAVDESNNNNLNADVNTVLV